MPSLGTLQVMAAASLSEPMTSLARRFETLHPGLHVELHFAGSQQLWYQIEQGAPVDVFASAHPAHGREALERGWTPAPHFFASNTLVVVYSERLGAIHDIEHLITPERRFVIGTATVPVGLYTEQALENAVRLGELPEAVRARWMAQVGSRELTVKAVLNKVILGAADAGIVYRSDTSSATAAGLRSFERPAAWQPSLLYPVMEIRRDAPHPLAAAFIQLIDSDAGQHVLASAGFRPGNLTSTLVAQ